MSLIYIKTREIPTSPPPIKDPLPGMAECHPPHQSKILFLGMARCHPLNNQRSPSCHGMVPPPNLSKVPFPGMIPYHSCEWYGITPLTNQRSPSWALHYVTPTNQRSPSWAWHGVTPPIKCPLPWHGMVSPSTNRKFPSCVWHGITPPPHKSTVPFPTMAWPSVMKYTFCVCISMSLPEHPVTSALTWLLGSL